MVSVAAEALTMLRPMGTVARLRVALEDLVDLPVGVCTEEGCRRLRASRAGVGIVGTSSVKAQVVSMTERPSGHDISLRLRRYILSTSLCFPPLSLLW